MRWWFAILVLGCLGLAHAQMGGPAKDKEPKKETKKDEKKEKVDAEAPKSPLTIEQLKLSPESVLILVDEMKDVLSLLPKMVLIRPEKLASMEERIKALEKLLAPERRAPGVCKLSGRLDGETLVLRG